MFEKKSTIPSDSWIDAALIPVSSLSTITPDVGDSQRTLSVKAPNADLRFNTPVTEGALTLLPLNPPIPRECHVGCVGPDVHCYKRVLRSLGFRPKKSPVDREFHIGFVPQVKDFQRSKRLIADGVIGPITYRALFQSFDDFDKWLIRHTKVKTTTGTDLIVQHALRSVAMAAYWHYAQIRPYPTWEGPDHIPTYTDCSGHYGLMRKWAGAKSPYGSYGWSGYGNTDTLLEIGEHVSSPEPGDAILYSNPGHVVTCIKWPMAVSFGSEDGPYYLDARYRGIQAFMRFPL